MELVAFLVFLAVVIAAIIAGAVYARPARRQAPDLAAGSNKPDKRNAYGPHAGR